MRVCGAVPVLDFLSSLTLGVAVTLLDLSFELGTAPADGGQIVVGKLAPPLLGLDLRSTLWRVKTLIFPYRIEVWDEAYVEELVALVGS